MKRLAAVVLLTLLTGAALSSCSPPTIGQVAIHRLGDGSLNAVIAGCKPGLQRVTAYLGDVSDSAPPAAQWTLRLDPHSLVDHVLEWPLMGRGSSDVLAVRPLEQAAVKSEITLLGATRNNEATASSTGLTPRALRRLQPDEYAFYSLDGDVLYGTRGDFVAGTCP